jgi:putative nucleotidyltransferase with HDIG domain
MQRKISTIQLRVGMYVAKLDTDWVNHPFWRTSFAIEDDATIAKIRASGIREVWIDTERGLDAANDANSPAAADPEASPPPAAAVAAPAVVAAPAREESMVHAMQKARRICEAAREEVHAMFADARMGRAISVKTVGPLVEEIASAVKGNAAALISVARLKTHDDYTYLHSVAVCALMVALSRELGLDDDATRKAGFGGMMHDLGKALMPHDVLNKPGKLSVEEFDVMKTHAARGYDLLVEAGEADAVTLEVTLHHHEKIDGSGYPHGLAADAISMWARMGAVCDVYDAVTSRRPYKEGWDPALSVRRMASWRGHFDEAVLRSFVKSVGIYPVGSLVRLRSEKLAVVVEPGRVSLVRPIVRVFFSTRSKEPIATHLLDLENPRANDAIVGPEDPDQWGFTHLAKLWLPD